MVSEFAFKCPHCKNAFDPDTILWSDIENANIPDKAIIYACPKCHTILSIVGRQG